MILEFFKNNYLELVGVPFSLAYLYFSINRKIWLWGVGIIASTVYVIIFFKASLYADMIQNVYYVVISIYGLVIWTREKNKSNKETYEVEVCKIPQGKIVPLIFVWAFVCLLVYLLIEITPKYLGISNASFSLLDSCLTSLAFVSTWMLTKKYIEQWIIWLFVNLAYIVIYAYKGLYLTCFLFVIYSIMSVVGYMEWKKHLRK